MSKKKSWGSLIFIQRFVWKYSLQNDPWELWRDIREIKIIESLVLINRYSHSRGNFILLLSWEELPKEYLLRDFLNRTQAQKEVPSIKPHSWNWYNLEPVISDLFEMMNLFITSKSHSEILVMNKKWVENSPYPNWSNIISGPFWNRSSIEFRICCRFSN